MEKALTSMASILQAENRLHRIGQHSPVTIISLQARQTIDEYWQHLLDRKQKLASQIFEMDTMPNLIQDDLAELLT